MGMTEGIGSEIERVKVGERNERWEGRGGEGGGIGRGKSERREEK